MKYLLLLISLFFTLLSVNAEDIKEQHELHINDIEFESILKKDIKVGKQLVIDLVKTKNDLLKKYDTEIDFEWSLAGNTIKKGYIYKKEFKTYGEKQLSLNIYSLDEGGKKLIKNKIIDLFIYKNINYLIVDNENIKKNTLDLYIEKAKSEGVYIREVLKSNEKGIKEENILNSLLGNGEYNGNNGNYITVWGDKNYIFSIISKINKEIIHSSSNKKINLVLLSPFNTDVLKNYIINFISNKEGIESILLLPESSKSQIWLNPSNIEYLENSLKVKEYEYININKNSTISNFLFISKFINSLSNNGISNSYIYLIILIPFLFTLISIFKHLVGLSLIGIMIPIALTILFFQIGLIITLIILFSLIIVNLILGKLTNKYTLLYTPKISFIIIINLVIIMLILDILFRYNLININISDTLFIIFFILICERFITVVLSKEFNEYKYNLLNTILFAIFSFLILNIGFVQTIILAYPEIILLLIPINFIIGKFTGLRITEYFRFKEVIKSIEE